MQERSVRTEGSDGYEFRATCGLELQDRKKAGLPMIRGVAVVYNQLSVDLGGFREQIAADALETVLASKPDVRAFDEHDPSKRLGRTTSRTLRLVNESAGLRVEIDPPDTEVGRAAVESIRRGDIDGMSFAFRVAPGGDEWLETQDGLIRTVREISELAEVSIVSWPAYPQTVASTTRARVREFFSRAVANRLGARIRAAETRGLSIATPTEKTT